MLSEIKEKLEEIDNQVYYGRVTGEPKIFNYLVYGRKKLQKAGTSRDDMKNKYFVAIVRENYIPEGLDLEVIKAMTSIPGMRLSDEEYQYHYVPIRKSNAVAEVLELSFVKSRKGIL